MSSATPTPSHQTTLTLVGDDPDTLRQTERAAQSLGLSVDAALGVDAALERRPRGTVVLDAASCAANAFVVARRLTSGGGVRLAMVFDESPDEVQLGIARFCGCGAVLDRSDIAAGLRRAAERWADQQAPRAGLDSVAPVLPETLLRQLGKGLAGDDHDPRPTRLIEALADPETSLFNYDFLTYKLDEEFKRSRRFEHALTCVMIELGGECAANVLQELGSVFLQAARDTDILGRFDLSSFLLLLPETPPDGARAMAERIVSTIGELGLRDVVGDPLELSIGIVSCPHPDVIRAADLYRLARQTAREASGSGRGVAVH